MLTARDTVNGMNLCTGLVAMAALHAVQDGIQRANELREVDRAHAVGQRYYIKRMAQRKAAVRRDAHAAMAKLLAERSRIHG